MEVKILKLAMYQQLFTKLRSILFEEKRRVQNEERVILNMLLNALQEPEYDATMFLRIEYHNERFVVLSLKMKRVAWLKLLPLEQ